MNLNEVLTKQNVITKIVLNDGDKELSKELKIKIMRIRMAYTKIKKSFDSEVQEFTQELIPEELQTLNSKTERTEEENTRMQELSDKVNMEFQEFLFQKGLEEVKDLIEDTLTEEEYFDIVDINSGNNVEINNNKVPAADFLEIIYELFVKQ